jgi:hypothetical protein
MREAFCALIATAMLVPSGYATAGFADDNTAFSLAISIMRGAAGQHARALLIEADVNGVEIARQTFILPHRAAATYDGPCMWTAAANASRFSPMLKSSLSAPI